MFILVHDNKYINSDLIVECRISEEMAGSGVYGVVFVDSHGGKHSVGGFSFSTALSVQARFIAAANYADYIEDYETEPEEIALYVRKAGNA